MQKLHIVIIHQSNPLVSYAPGGGVRHTQNLVRHYLERGYQVTYLGASTHREEDTQLPDQLVFRPLVRQDTYWLPYFIKLVFTLLFFKYEQNMVFHIQRTYFAVPFLLVLRKAPLVCTLHGVTLNEMWLKRPRLRRIIYPVVIAFEWQCFRRINHLIFINKKIQQIYSDRFEDAAFKTKSSVIPHGQDLALFYPRNKHQLRTKHTIPLDVDLIIFVGRLHVVKNVGFILKAMQRLLIRRPAAQLHLLGAGEELAALQALATKLDIASNVHWWQETEYSEVPNLLSMADVLVMSSIYEGVPSVVMESLASGTPVVTLNVGNVTDVIVSDALGCVIEDRQDLESYVDALDETLARKNDVSPDVIHQTALRVLERYDWERVTGEVIDVYKKTLTEYTRGL